MAHHEIVADGSGERTSCGDSGRNAAETGARPYLDPQRRPPGAARLSGGRNVVQSFGRVRGRKSHAAPTSVRGSEFLFVRARRPELRALARPIDDRAVDRSGASGPFGGEGRTAGSVVGARSVTKRRRGLVVGMTALPFLFVALRIGTRGVLEPSRRTKAKCSSCWMRWKTAMSSLETTRRSGLSFGHRNLSCGASWSVASRRRLLGQPGRRRNGLMASFASAPRRLRRVTRRCLPQTCRKPEIVIAPELEKIRRFLEPATVGGQALSLGGIMIRARHRHLGPDLVGVPSGRAVLRAAGLAAVTRDGKQIGRLRAAVRVLVTWSPAILWAIGLFIYFEIAARDTSSYSRRGG